MHSEKRSDRTAYVHGLPATTNLNIGQFITHTDFDMRQQILGHEAHRGSAFSLYIAGRMALELAYEAPDQDQSLALLTQAGDLWQAASSHKAVRLDQASGGADLQRSMLFTHYWHLLENHLPPDHVLEASYASLLQTAQEHQKALKTETNRTTIFELRGNLAELSTLLLLQRFAIQNGEGCWSATLSKLSDDCGADGRPGSFISHGWDVGVHTQYDEANPQLQYKIQVKSQRYHKRHERDRQYADDITMVYVRDDLHIDGTFMPLEQITQECLAEQQGDQESAQRLDVRTDRLLRILN